MGVGSSWSFATLMEMSKMRLKLPNTWALSEFIWLQFGKQCQGEDSAKSSFQPNHTLLFQSWTEVWGTSAHYNYWWVLKGNWNTDDSLTAGIKCSKPNTFQSKPAAQTRFWNHHLPPPAKLSIIIIVRFAKRLRVNQGRFLMLYTSYGKPMLR